MNVCCALSGHNEIVQISESDNILNAYALLIHCTAGNALLMQYEAKINRRFHILNIHIIHYIHYTINIDIIFILLWGMKRSSAGQHP